MEEIDAELFKHFYVDVYVHEDYGTARLHLITHVT